MALKDVIFQENPTKTIEVLGKNIEVRGLTTRDTLAMNVDFGKLLDDANGQDIKLVLNSVVEVLSNIIVTVGGQKPTSTDETREWLLSQSQPVVMDIFKKADVFGAPAEEIKN